MLVDFELGQGGRRGTLLVGLGIDDFLAVDNDDLLPLLLLDLNRFLDDGHLDSLRLWSSRSGDRIVEDLGQVLIILLLLLLALVLIFRHFLLLRCWWYIS